MVPLYTLKWCFTYGTFFAGLLFSGKITEPLTIEDGMVNLKFNSNCIAVICPVKENAIKTWRLNHITSFGQCGGILTFECCSTCSDPGTSRCSINVVQDKPTIILNLMEKAIRSNPNTSEIHYERSILGDIYHCDHECGQPQRLFPAFSDPNIFRSASQSPQKDVLVPIDIHEFEIPFSTLSSGKSNDSGLPGTPPLQHDILSLNGSNIPSPFEVKPSMQADNLGYSNTPRSSISITPPMHSRNMTEIAQDLEENNHAHKKSSERDPQVFNRFSRHNYTDIKTTSSSPRQNRMEDNVQYTSIQLGLRRIDSPSRDKRLSQQKLEPVDENDGIYDTPNCEPPYWEIANGVLSPPMTPGTNIKMDSNSNLTGLRNSIIQSTSSIYTPGSDLKERDEDFEDLPPVPSRLCRMRPARPPVKEPVVINRYNPRGRSRLHSSGDVLESVHQFKSPKLGSMDNLSIEGRPNMRDMSRDSRNDLLTKLHEQDEILTRVLARSRNERNEELDGTREEGFDRPYRFPNEENDHELENRLLSSPTNSTHIRSGRSSSSSDRGIERVLTKVASNTVRGYAYKIQIPQSNIEYDVPRRAAPVPDLANLRTDAPPKPLRYTIASADT